MSVVSKIGTFPNCVPVTVLPTRTLHAAFVSVFNSNEIVYVFPTSTANTARVSLLAIFVGSIVIFCEAFPSLLSAASVSSVFVIPVVTVCSKPSAKPSALESVSIQGFPNLL